MKHLLHQKAVEDAQITYEHFKRRLITTETDGFIDRAREHVESDERRRETQAKKACYFFEEGKTHLAQTDVSYVVPNSLIIQARG